MKYLQHLIKNKRDKLKESQGVFGQRFGKSHAAVSDWESGKSSPPSDVVEFIIADLVTLPTSYLRVCHFCQGKGFIDLKLKGYHDVEGYYQE